MAGASAVAATASDPCAGDPPTPSREHPLNLDASMKLGVLNDLQPRFRTRNRSLCTDAFNLGSGAVHRKPERIRRAVHGRASREEAGNPMTRHRRPARATRRSRDQSGQPDRALRQRAHAGHRNHRRVDRTSSGRRLEEQHHADRSGAGTQEVSAAASNANERARHQAGHKR